MKIRSRTLNILMSVLATVGLRCLFLTVRKSFHPAVPDGMPYFRPLSALRYVFCMWHDTIVMAVFAGKTRHLSGLISQHRDGGYLADSVRIAGIYPVRGSSSRGGAQAIAQLLDRPDLHLAITPDGPRGPRHELKDGLLYLASRSHRPIIPTALAADRYWSVPGGWSTMTIPKPFSRCVLVAGPPIHIPEDVSREDLVRYRQQLESEMRRMEHICQRLVEGDHSAAEFIATPGAWPESSQMQKAA
ncbi:MAG: lysophospholipid acyltransferase family protein [Planctomycetaceae bacterium]|nr:lysophospholipid acyltransferase family protein [Planctomycetaceae bacterium]